ncbi:fungal-specific transcription factor domain-containing protein [Xylogone sp. PMI_703]|nr:fungal-specific transcription factor domain-containing protein [Xylogone sp. PMI_703]
MSVPYPDSRIWETASGVIGPAHRKRSSRACRSCRKRKIIGLVISRRLIAEAIKPYFTQDSQSENRRDSGNIQKGRQTLLDGRRQAQDTNQKPPEPVEGDAQSQLTPSNSPSYRICAESQPQQQLLEERSDIIDTTHAQLNVPAYAESPPSLMQTPPDSTAEDFLFEPHSIYETQDGVPNSNTGRPLNLCSPAESCRNLTLPPYFKPFPSSISEEDLDYLANKGALSIPPKELRNALLKSFIDFVHPYMPIVSLEEVISAIERENGEGGTISLLLFQSIMFTGVAFVDTKSLEKGGFETRKIARRVLFHRARTLYDFSCEHDDITLIQSFLLLSYWFESPNDEKNTRHWLALAVSLGQIIGLHRNPEQRSNRHLLKRIFWSSFTRDRLVTLATKHPVLIRYGECDVPMLTMDDFEILDISWNKSCVSGCRFLENEALQRRLALMFIESAKLCIPLGQILEPASSPRSINQGYDTPNSIRRRMILLASNNGTPLSVSQKEHESLAKWAENLPDGVIYRRPSGDKINKLLTVHAALLQMIYYATVISATKKLSASHQLHRPGSLDVYVAVEKISLAAMEITKVAQDLQELDLIQYLPTSGVTPIMIASIVHLQLVKEGGRSIRKTNTSAFHRCMQVTQKLRESYFSADVAYALMTKAARWISAGDIHSSLQREEEAQNTDARATNLHSHESINNMSTNVPLPQEFRTQSSEFSQTTLSPLGLSLDYNAPDSQLSGFDPSDIMFEDLLDEDSIDNLFVNGLHPKPFATSV